MFEIVDRFKVKRKEPFPRDDPWSSEAADIDFATYGGKDVWKGINENVTNAIGDAW
jgi:hypothetical protein